MLQTRSPSGAMVIASLLLFACSDAQTRSAEEVGRSSQAIYSGTTPLHTAEELGVALVDAPDGRGTREWGTGTFIDNTHVLTAWHLVNDGARTPSSILLQMGAQTFQTTKVFKHKSLDIAVLRVSPPATINGNGSNYSRPVATLTGDEVYQQGISDVVCYGYGANDLVAGNDPTVIKVLDAVRRGTGYADRADDLTSLHPHVLSRKDDLVKRGLMTAEQIDRMGELAPKLLSGEGGSPEAKAAALLRNRAFTHFYQAWQEIERHLDFLYAFDPEGYASYPTLYPHRPPKKKPIVGPPVV